MQIQHTYTPVPSASVAKNDAFSTGRATSPTRKATNGSSSDSWRARSAGVLRGCDWDGVPVLLFLVGEACVHATSVRRRERASREGLRAARVLPPSVFVCVWVK